METKKRVLRVRIGLFFPDTQSGGPGGILLISARELVSDLKKTVEHADSGDTNAWNGHQIEPNWNRRKNPDHADNSITEIG